MRGFISPIIAAVLTAGISFSAFGKRATDAANETGLSDEARQKKSDELSGKSDSEFLRCFADKAAQQKGYAGAVAAAQALFDRLP